MFKINEDDLNWQDDEDTNVNSKKGKNKKNKRGPAPASNISYQKKTQAAAQPSQAINKN